MATDSLSRSAAPGTKEERKVTCNIEYVGSIKHLTGRSSDVLQVRIGCTIREIIGMLADKYGEDFRRRVLTTGETLRANVLIFLNGRDVNYQDDLESVTVEGDSQGRIIMLVPAEEGG